MEQPKFRALYTPSYVPDETWLKYQLLFWDQINRIVPQTMQDQYGDSYIEERFGIDPAFAPAISPTEADLTYFNEHQQAITEAFNSIKDKEGRFEDQNNYFGVHPDKATPWVFEFLKENELAIDQQLVNYYEHNFHHLG